MSTKQATKYVHQDEYVAEVTVELLYTGEGWSPYLTLEDANRLDAVRMALREGDLKLAGTMAKVFKLTPVAA